MQRIPDAAVIGEIERQVGVGIKIPATVHALDDYKRYYWLDGEVVVGQFRKKHSSVELKSDGSANDVSLVTFDSYAFVQDGGCAILNLHYYGTGDPRNSLKCGGR